MSETKIGYKGTDAQMKCRDVQFELGKTYYLDEKDKVQVLPDGYNIIKNKIELCSKEAIHYCNELDKVYAHYPNNGKNRFFKVEIIGDFKDETNQSKSGCRVIKFLEEISAEEINRIAKEKEEEGLDKKMHLETVRELQEKNPELIIGGSISLYLQGVRLDRFHSGMCDYDFILPYYKKLSSDKVDMHESDDEEFSGSDFEQKLEINGVKADVRISPTSRYELTEYKGFTYKTIPLLVTLEAKVRYGLKKGGEKHKADIKEMILKQK